MSFIKNKIAVVTLDYMASMFYKNLIKELFGEIVTTSSYNVLDDSIKNIIKPELFVVTTDTFVGFAM